MAVVERMRALPVTPSPPPPAPKTEHPLDSEAMAVILRVQHSPSSGGQTQGPRSAPRPAIKPGQGPPLAGQQFHHSPPSAPPLGGTNTFHRTHPVLLIHPVPHEHVLQGPCIVAELGDELPWPCLTSKELASWNALFLFRPLTPWLSIVGLPPGLTRGQPASLSKPGGGGRTAKKAPDTGCADAEGRAGSAAGRAEQGLSKKLTFAQKPHGEKFFKAFYQILVLKTHARR